MLRGPDFRVLRETEDGVRMVLIRENLSFLRLLNNDKNDFKLNVILLSKIYIYNVRSTAISINAVVLFHVLAKNMESHAKVKTLF